MSRLYDIKSRMYREREKERGPKEMKLATATACTVDKHTANNVLLDNTLHNIDGAIKPIGD